ncbi:3-hydroxyacyl-CoA dehydrogenase [Microbacterium marmarense]|uniref:3-hydroxyacyl-CoA dehydrogenase n=1 Tax=Microbacterium marmarense TaxID=3122051 RepID=A0ABU8LUF2_9MICO
MNTLNNVTVLGGGVLGAQIAYQAAFHGKNVTVYDINDEALEAARERFNKLVSVYVEAMPDAEEGQAAKAAESISLSSDLAEAVVDADLVIEAVPEILDLKKKVFSDLAKVAPEKTIFATNSSTMVPSQYAAEAGRPDRFLALHFANNIWVQNVAEVMGTERTSNEAYDAVVAYAEETGMDPILVKKEQPGYVLNSLLVPLLNAASALYVNGVADVETIDHTWRKGTGAQSGPFQMYDVIGLRTAYNVSSASDNPSSIKFAEILKTEFLDKGKFGVASGEGFYKY